MSDFEEFQAEFLPRVVEAETAIHRGDVGPRLALWSQQDPVTLFGAFGPCNIGWNDVSRTFGWVAERFSNVSAYSIEIVAAGVSGDLAYTVWYERSTVSLDGAPRRPQTVRATQVYRRENGEWKVVHRHGDFQPADESPHP